MSERLTDEELRCLSLNVGSLSVGEPVTPEYVAEHVRERVKPQLASVIAELRERRAADLTSEEVEALRGLAMHIRAIYKGVAWDVPLLVIDKLTRGGR